MTSAYILVVAILILGGLLAAVGDRIGSGVGKKRLRLFNLRPRQTATLMTIVTGIVIAASTLGLLFGLSKSLRQGVFELDTLLSERRAAIKQLEQELQTTQNEKKTVEKALSNAKSEQASAQERLNTINKSFQQSREQLKRVSAQLKTLRADIQNLVTERQQLIQQKSQLAQQKTQLAEQISQLQAQVKARDEQLTQQDQILAQRQIRLQQLEAEQKTLQDEINQRDERIVELDRAIADKNQTLEYRESKLKELETQITFLRREVEILEQYYETYQELREKEIAIVKGQVLSFGAFRVVDPNAVVSVIDQLLREANLAAIQATQPDNTNPNQRVVQITKAQVEQLIQQLQDGREYVVRILSAGNYVKGEKEVRVFADIALNQKIFDKDQEITTVSIDTQNMSEEDIQNRLDLLLSAAQFRARRAGVLGVIQVEDGRLTTLIEFIAKVQQSDEPLDSIQAVASETAYTVGPLKIRLIALRNGEVIFST